MMSSDSVNGASARVGGPVELDVSPLRAGDVDVLAKEAARLAGRTRKLRPFRGRDRRSALRSTGIPPMWSW